MKQTQWKIVLGIALGMGMIWATSATALDWGWAKNPATQRSAAPISQAAQEAVTKPAIINEGNLSSLQFYLNSCTAAPTCANGYILSEQACPNELPGDLPSSAYPVKSCYACNPPSTVASISNDQLCLAKGYSVGAFPQYPAWLDGKYYCLGATAKTTSPLEFLQLCPPNMVPEISSDGFVRAVSYNYYEYGYACRFVATTRSSCNQCGSIAVPGGPNGEIYCILPSNLPPADPKQPCK